MAKEFATTIKIGLNSTQFASGTTDVNRQIKVLDSSFKAVSAQTKAFGKSTDALREKQQILTQKIQLQTGKVAGLKEQYEKSKRETGENSRATEQLAIRYNNAVAGLNRFEGQLNNVTNELGQQKSKFDGLSDKIKKANDGFKTIAKGVAVAGAALAGMGAGALKLALDIGNTADRLLDLNSITGMSTDEIQRWQHASVIAGTSTEAMTEASQKLTQTMDTMSSGSGKAAESAKKLGYSYEQLSGMDADERMNVLITALQGVEDKTERAKMGTDLFGKKWAEIAPIVDLGVEGLKNAKDNANVFTPEQLNDANNFRIEWDNLKYTMTQFAGVIGAKLIPYFNKFAEKIKTIMPEIKGKIDDALTFAEDIFTKLGDAVEFVKDNADILIPVLAGLVVTIGSLQIINAVNGLMAVWKASTFAQTLAQEGLNVALTANPIGIVVVAIGALVTAGVTLYMHWDTVTKKAKELWDKLSNTFTGIKTSISQKWNEIKQNTSNTWDNIKNFVPTKIEDMKKSAINKFNALKDSIKSIGSRIKQSLKDMFDIKLPHFSLKTSTKSIMGKEIKYPSGFGVKWYDKGGIFDRPSVIGVGEKRPEFVGALDDLRYLIRGELKANNTTNNNNNAVTVQHMTVRNDNDINLIARQLHNLQRNAGRGVGVV